MLPEGSIYKHLERKTHKLIPAEYFCIFISSEYKNTGYIQAVLNNMKPSTQNVTKIEVYLLQKQTNNKK